MRSNPISFPGLFPGLEINIDPIALHIGHGVYWYGIIIALGFILAVVFCSRRASRYGIRPDDLYDMLIIATPLSIIGARAYYVIFYLDLFRNADGGISPGKVVAIWDGGLAIYGGVIVAVLTVFVFCRVKKIRVGAMLDLGCMGLLIGQLIGRWGNFVNREAFGTETTLPWRMRLWESADHFIEVHPTFLYESLWNLIGLLLIIFVVEKARKFDGQNFLFYLFWYGLGRVWIESLRVDSLYLFNLQLFGAPVRVSQLLSAVLCIVAAILLIYNLWIKKHDPANLYVHEVEKRGVLTDGGQDGR
jgi:phosphatidylglycerol:prolipoprotein diacylglycerol transferase